MSRILRTLAIILLFAQIGWAQNGTTHANLVAEFNFEGNLLDAVTTLSGEAFGGVTYEADRFGNPAAAVCFDGTDGHVNLGNLGTLDGFTVPENITHTIWVKLDPESGSGGVFTRRTNADQGYLTFYYNANHPQNMQDFTQRYPHANPNNPRIILVPEGPFYLSSTFTNQPANLGEWQHLAFSKVGTTYQVHVNGVLITEYTDTYNFIYNGAPTGFGDVILGMAPAWRNVDVGNLATIKGCVDDFRIYDNNLSNEQITEDFIVSSSQNTWTFDLEAVQGGNTAGVTFGMADDATDGLDSAIDTPEPPPAVSSLRAYFHRPEWEGMLGDSYIADIRAGHDMTGTTEVWPINFVSDTAGEIFVTITRPLDLDLPVVIRDELGEVVTFDLNTATFQFIVNSDGITTYNYTITVGEILLPELIIGNNLSGPAIWDNSVDRELTWTASSGTGPLDITISFFANLFDEPTVVYTGSAATGSFLFNVPNIEYTNDAWFYVSLTDGLNTVDYSSEQLITIASNTQILDYAGGWHMVSNPLGTASPVSNVATDPTFIFNWNGSGYQQAQSIDLFTGSWLGAYGSGTITATGTVLETNQTYNASPGWSMLGSPLMRPVDVSQMTFETGGVTYDYADAVLNDVIAGIYEYFAESFFEASTLYPFDAFWLGVSSATPVVVTYPIHGVVVGKELLNSTESDNIMATLTIVGGGMQQEFRIGTQVQNQPMPPSYPNGLILGLMGEQTILGNLYMAKTVSTSEVIETPLRSLGQTKTLTISWGNQDFSDMKFSLHTFDGSIYDLSTEGSVTWNTSDPAPVVISSPTTASTENNDFALPLSIELGQNYPNPFNPTSRISYQLPAEGMVRLAVYDLIGREVSVLVNERKSAGEHFVNFNASGLSSGVYVYRLDVEGVVLTRKMTLVK
jgi:hypothetical protein